MAKSATKNRWLWMILWVYLFAVGVVVGTALSACKFDRVVPMAREIDLGTLEAGHELKIGMQFKNRSLRTVKLTGYQSGCGCMRVEGLPTTVGPLQTVTVRSSIKANKKSPERSYGFELKLLTDFGPVEAVTVLVHVGQSN